MEGRGVTNYSSNAPSYGYSAQTTQFDEELIRRNIVTREQALQARGMDAETAAQLATAATMSSTAVVVVETVHSESDDDDDDDDDKFLRAYREKRLAEMKQQAVVVGESSTPPHFGQVVSIDRTEWARHVNEASKHSWVVIVLTSSDVLRTGSVEQSANELASRHPTIKFVRIPSHSAIANWPTENLPTVFCYRHGKLQHQMIRLPTDLTESQLQAQLVELSVISPQKFSNE